jgi:trk system potassium uptake protein TrkH
VKFLLGPIMWGLALLMLAPCALAWIAGSPNLKPFLISETATVIAAIIFSVSKKGIAPHMRVREMFLLTNLSWLTVCIFGALPFIFSHTVASFTDAIFESVSGVTTTGATVLSGLDDLPRDILLWRSMMQWIGGLGIIALGAAVLPYLKIGGMRLFQTESSDLSEKALPNTRRILRQLLYIYLLISAACAASYGFAGMTPFDAINHAMTTVSTGGFSTHDRSIAYFQSGQVESVAIMFMLIAAIPFMLYLSLYLGRSRDLLRDGQVRTMLGLYFFVIVLALTWLKATSQNDISEALRGAAFNVISIGTTTGYVSADYMTWGSFAVVIFFFLTFVGGCSGSTSGGIKIFRFNIASVMFRETIQRLLHPSSVYARSIHGRQLTDEIVSSVMAFCLAFAVVVGMVAVMLAAAGNDFVTSFSAAATATANVGPGIGETIGPSSNFASLTPASKWILCFAMLLGRLEIFTALILLTPAFWRD